MKYRIIKSSNIQEKDYNFIKVKQLLNAKDIANMSIALIEINGINRKIINKRSDATYFILDGKGVFNVNGDEESVSKGDLIFIPKGTSYFDSGNMRMISFNNPRYDSEFVEYLS